MTVRNLIVALAVSASSIFGMELRPPLELETAAVLPHGIRSPRWKTALLSVVDRYGQDQGTVPLGIKLNKAVSWREVIDAQSTEDAKAQARALLGHLGFADTDSPGQTTGAVRVSANVQVPVIAYGVTDRWTAALALPMVSASIAAASGLLKSSQGQAFVSAAESASGPPKALEAVQKLNDPVNQKLARMGYEPVRSFDVSGIGDLRLVQKYLAHQGSQDSLVAKFEITAPTGTPPNPDRVVDLPLGDGQWDLGGGVSYDRRLSGDLASNISLNYVWQLPHRVVRRVPTASNDVLSEDRESLTRKIGDQWNAQASLKYQWREYGLTLSAGYSYQKQFRTQYDGGTLAAERYRWLADLTSFDAEMDMHSAVAQLGFSTIDFYRAEIFPVPLQLSIAYSRPIAGSNSTANDLIAGELVAFF